MARYITGQDEQQQSSYAAPSPSVYDMSQPQQQQQQQNSYGGTYTIPNTQVTSSAQKLPGEAINAPTNPAGTVIGVASTANEDGQPQNPTGISREDYRDKWMSSGARTLDDLKRFLAQYGGQLLSDNGTVKTPHGETLDMLIGARAQQAGIGNASAGWTGIGTGYAAPNNLPNSINNVINTQTNQEPVKTNFAAPRPGLNTIRNLTEQNRGAQFNPYVSGYNPSLLNR